MNFASHLQIIPVEVVKNGGWLSLRKKILVYLQTQIFVSSNEACNEMGWACGAYGWGEWGVQGLGGEIGGKETTGET